MLFKLYDKAYNYLLEGIISAKDNRYFLLKLIFGTFLISIFFAFPPYHVINANMYEVYWTPILDQIADPFHPKQYELATHAAKRGFRLTVPVLANILGFKIWGCIILQSLFGIYSLFLTFRLFNKIFNDVVVATFLLLSFIFIYVGFGAFYDLRGMFDNIAIGFLLIALNYSNPFIVFISILASAFTDERGLIASSLIFLYYSVSFNEDKKLRFTILNFDYQKFAILTSWIFYFLCRFYLSHYKGFYTSTDGANFILALNQLNNLPLGIFSALEGFWLILISSLLILLKNKDYLISIFIIVISLIILFVGSCVTDLTRSMMYIFPVCFIGSHIIFNNESHENIRKLAFLVLVISFLFPSYYFYGEFYTRWCFPLPFRIIHMLNSYFLKM